MNANEATTHRNAAHRGKRRPLHDYGRLYHEHLNAEYRNLQGGATDPVACAAIEAILAKPHPTWTDLHALELALLRIRPLEAVRRQVWSVRSKFRDLAGPAEYAAYLASNPPDPETAPEPILRADVERLLAEFHWLGHFAPLREGIRDGYAKRLGIITLVVLTAAGVLIALEYRKPEPLLPSLLLVLFLGVLGGFVSVQQRLQSVPTGGDPIANIVALEQGWFGIYLAPLSGAIFAMVLYLMFIGGLLEGVLFPKILTARPADQGLSFKGFAMETGPASGVDFAKLLIWSFIAGFAERLVPDTLDRMVDRGSRSEVDRPRPGLVSRPAVEPHVPARD